MRGCKKRTERVTGVKRVHSQLLTLEAPEGKCDRLSVISHERSHVQAAEDSCCWCESVSVDMTGEVTIMQRNVNG